jgi:hypothetical protein
MERLKFDEYGDPSFTSKVVQIQAADGAVYPSEPGQVTNPGQALRPETIYLMDSLRLFRPLNGKTKMWAWVQIISSLSLGFFSLVALLSSFGYHKSGTGTNNSSGLASPCGNFTGALSDPAGMPLAMLVHAAADAAAASKSLTA